MPYLRGFPAFLIFLDRSSMVVYGGCHNVSFSGQCVIFVSDHSGVYRSCGILFLVYNVIVDFQHHLLRITQKLSNHLY